MFEQTVNFPSLGCPREDIPQGLILRGIPSYRRRVDEVTTRKWKANEDCKLGFLCHF